MSSLLGSVKYKNSLTGVSSIEGLSSFSSGSPGMALSTQSLLSSGAKFAPALGSVTMQPSRSFCQLASLYAGCVATVEAIAKSVIAIRIGSKTETARRTLDSVSSSTGVASKVASITQGATGFIEDALTKFKRVPPSSLSTAGAVSAMAATILSPLGGVLSLVKNSLSFFFAGSFACCVVVLWVTTYPKPASAKIAATSILLPQAFKFCCLLRVASNVFSWLPYQDHGSGYRNQMEFQRLPEVDEASVSSDSNLSPGGYKGGLSNG